MAKDKIKITDYISHDDYVKYHMSGMGAGDIRKGIENGTIKSSYKKPTNNGNGGGSNVDASNLPNISGGGGNGAASPESVASGVANGDWMNPNTSYIKSGAYLDNDNLDPRSKSAMASFARQGINFDSVPSNISEYSGIDSSASDAEKLSSYIYNNMRNATPEQQAEALQGVQGLYDEAGIGGDVYSAYNNYVFGDGTGTNGYAAEQAQRNAAPEQGEYQLSNSAQRAKATAERDSVKQQVDEYRDSIYNALKAKPENRYKSPEELKLLADQAFDDKVRTQPNGDLAKAVASLDRLDTTIGQLTSAIDAENAAAEKENVDYRTDYIGDKYMQSAVDFVQENPSVARRIAMDYAEQKLGMSREDAARYASNIIANNNGGTGNVVNPELELLTSQPELALAFASNGGAYTNYDSLMNEYARQRQGAAEEYRRQQMTGNRFNSGNYSPYSNNNLFTYQPKF